MATIKKQDNKYLVRIPYKENGKWKSLKRTFRTKPKAQAYVLEMEVKKANNVPIAQAEQTFPEYFNNWYETYKEPKIAPATKLRYKDSYRLILLNFSGIKLTEMTRSIYQQFINEFGQVHSVASVKKFHSHMRAAVTDAYADGLIPRDFTHNISIIGQAGKPEDDKYLDMVDMEKLAADMQTNPSPLMISHAMIVTSLQTGMRLAEVAALTEKDFYPKFNRIVVNKTWNYLAKEHFISTGDHPEIDFKPTKNKQSNRTIDISPELTQFLQTVILIQHELNSNENPYQLLFLNNRGGIPTSDSLRHVLERACVRLGLDHVITFHGLRHTHASYLLAKGVKIEYISKRLGHASIATTLRTYTHLLAETKDDEAQHATEVLSQLFKPKEPSNVTNLVAKK